MSETNGGNLERRVSALEAARKEMEDAMLVHATLESRAATRIKEHAEFIARHEKMMARHETMMAEFDDKLNGLIGWPDGFRKS